MAPEPTLSSPAPCDRDSQRAGRASLRANESTLYQRDRHPSAALSPDRLPHERLELVRAIEAGEELLTTGLVLQEPTPTCSIVRWR
jgi:hypothetical protein